MGKHGPCCHCGVTSTPLWRNGPPEKPVLCNACGSRWRTKGSLTNYIPLHAREAFDTAELKVPKVIAFRSNEQKLHKNNQNKWKFESECEMQYYGQNFCKFIEGDTSNRSSSGSAVSGSNSCLHYGTDDASNITVSIPGSVQSNACDSLIPSKKRSFVTRPKLSVEKLIKELYSIWHEEQASNLSINSEDDLLYSCSTPLGSIEIGYGSVLIKTASSKSVEEESEASSFPVDKSYNTNYALSKKIDGESDRPITQNLAGLSDLSSLKRKHERQNQIHSDLKGTARSPKRVRHSGDDSPPSKCLTQLDSSHDAACFSPRRVSAVLPDKSSTFSSPTQFIADSCESKMLLNVPTNTSIAEAELLYHPWKKKTNRNGSPSVVDM
ncbi:GATA transcription factor 26-like isoform X1 [Zingiber officinale]|uniref:GATA transcription factor 26-like isoform X1 n=1 Tax=Zingiber officinale TaxID=94328 RepID=UPI001C4CB399|nr:GATA transcription factor 26-like isoform X1 [Zingiber officinale]